MRLLPAWVGGGGVLPAGILPSAEGDEAAELLVESCGLNEFLECDVLAVAPVVVRVGRVVDLLKFGLAAAQGGRDGQQVLQGQQAQHGGRE